MVKDIFILCAFHHTLMPEGILLLPYTNVMSIGTETSLRRMVLGLGKPKSKIIIRYDRPYQESLQLCVVILDKCQMAVQQTSRVEP